MRQMGWVRCGGSQVWRRRRSIGILAFPGASRASASWRLIGRWRNVWRGRSWGIEMGRRGEVRGWGRGYDCGAALLRSSGDGVWAVRGVEGLDELVRRGEEDGKPAVTGGILGAGNPVVRRDLHGRVVYVRGARTRTRGGAEGQRVRRGRGGSWHGYRVDERRRRVFMRCVWS